MTIAPAFTEPVAALPSRERLLRGLAASIKERGYRETKISDIVAHARTSRRTFYEVFETKDDCFLALLFEIHQLLQAEIAAAVDPKAPWDEQVRAGVGAWVDTIAAEPEVGLSWIRELPSLGTRAVEAQRYAMRTFTKLLIELSSTAEMRKAGIEPISEARAVILLGGLRELAAGVVEHGEDIRTIRAEAIDAALALLAPLAKPATTSRRRGSRSKENS
ncbi:MAG: TetR/AcrR family transcriptional regulator [Frankiaceae bacterium]|nr:TetR/AcrR family transcriptional regulator [Frankiaceae bacterium]MBV9872650.1 TetR/AcrR family transcriptional regulator [Frankiaceae bacterium]